MTDTERETINKALQYLSGRCDFANSLDGQGFNAFDATFGHELANKITVGIPLSDRQYEAALKMLRKYAGQLDGVVELPDSIAPSAPVPTEKKQSPVSKKTISIHLGMYAIRFPYDAKLVEAVKGIPGRRFNTDNSRDKHWTAPLSSSVQVEAFAKKHGFTMEGDAQSVVAKATEKASALESGSRATAASIEVAGLGGDLRPFQKAGVAYALTAKRTFIADEMGLGKTVQALATIQAANAYPALVVVPACVKLNWRREAQKWLPGKRIVVISGGPGNGNSNLDLTAFDVVILNYDIVGKWQERLESIRFKSIVVDESHYVKNRKAQRTVAVKALAAKIDYRLFLTGTPIVNRPQELITQLDALGTLDALGGFWGFANRYCAAYRGRFGLEFGEPQHLDELNERLRQTCYVRRLKADVLKELPPKTRTVLPVEITNRKDYDRAQMDFIAWVSENEGARKAQKAQNAEHLAKIEGLKQLAVAGKLEAVREWVSDFLETGEKLVLFAWHRSAVHQLAEAFDAPSISGDTSLEDRQAAIDRFQNDASCHLIVCNIKAAGVGITLTAASNVAFVELGWTPADHDQAEDRCHRIGQNDNVTAWYLVAENTIEEKIAALIDRKRGVVNQATDGDRADIETGMITALLADMREQGA